MACAITFGRKHNFGAKVYPAVNKDYPDRGYTAVDADNNDIFDIPGKDFKRGKGVHVTDLTV